MSNPNFDNIIATTLKHYWAPDGKATDNIFARSALLDWLVKSKLDVQGGATAVAPLESAQNGTFQFYSNYDVLTPVHGEEIVTAAEYSWKQAAIFVPMSGMEEAKNSGQKQIVNLLKTKIENAERTAAEKFETAFLQYDGTESSGKAWGGLPLLVGNASSSITSVGGIDAATYSYWRSDVATTATMSLTLMSTAYNNVSWPADMCDFEITTQTLYEKYESLLQPNQRFTDPKTAEAGFTNLLHRGAKVVWSDLMPTTQYYFLNSRHLKLAVLDGQWMKWNGFVKPFDRDAKYGLITNYGALVTNERRKLGRRIWTP